MSCKQFGAMVLAIVWIDFSRVSLISMASDQVS